ncbi:MULTISPECIES: D-alanyl-D-alanine carboxypeptidase/D-alanyl-D-alanine-endopeptidase [unclassified Leptolyngbya]|uniref:D-alanyl-D-alanine carboxypeptidase/D-alanyl-D-alanine endopeptidase n=1 Tax=unclassified Leptolyngbya TaxID=2650499 RepID=UPI001681F8C8|nr:MULTISPECIES: D-alanyl-D-alanine carboxypeptidase/D-alanyl-D-alanine-endopeptidase [unclassified Leptolyngbya]MBD1912316.1 D-alanyl-D-alanine carboxypeptidase/D-alanyl-D-alanine-endopeptidase [Leptolyngbya sp. FACHB-8]MBD2158048.1 D-alanyl-D-alanine carboxypeptidase/D-alanyl-D-alanine-endopeptidase [Leptolyngbya sp. FACHB-16]
MTERKRWRSLALALALVGAGGWRSPLLASICPADLPQAIETILQQQSISRRARWGIQVSPITGGEPLYTRDAQQFFIPASNIKLLTTAAALTELGPDYQIRTSVYQLPSAAGETVLRVVGRGDPTFTAESLQNLAQQIYNQGVRRIDRLEVDDSYFTGDPINPNWEWEDLQAGYGAPVSSLMLDGNAIALQLTPQSSGQPLHVAFNNPVDAGNWQIINLSRTLPAGSNEEEFTQVQQDGQRRVLRIEGQLQAGSEAVEEAIATPDPNGRFLRHFQSALRAVGITVERGTTPNTATFPPLPSSASEIAFTLSPPLSYLITQANTESENLYAETLLRQIGVRHTLSQPSTLVAGLEGVEAILAPLGVDPDSIDQTDGSGLARRNLATPEAFVQTLQAMHRGPAAQMYQNSLSVAGVSGTLQNRFQGTPVEGHLWGKTGAISGIAALSGYLEPDHHPPLAFSILVNHFDQPVRTIRPTIDQIVVLLADLSSCSSN